MNVFLCSPIYNGMMHRGAARSLWDTASQRHNLFVYTFGSSLIPTNCNQLWCEALNARRSRDLNWFAMLHADVEPDSCWVDALIAEAERTGADFLSAVVPIKASDGMTSTAIASPGRYGYHCRLTQAQVRHESFPDTFDLHAAADALERLPEPLRVADVPRIALLANTGCMVCRLDRDWCERVSFEAFDGIECVNGVWQPVFKPEDWVFTQRIAEQGGKVMATRLVNVVHWGMQGWPSNQVWGAGRDA
jgi:hypothetical protein